MSLRSRIATVAALLVLAAVVVTSIVQTLAARRAILEQTRAGGDGIANLLARVAAFVEDVPAAVEDEIGRHMIAEARLLAAYVAVAEKAGLTREAIVEQLSDVAEDTVIDQLLVTGTDAVGTIDTERPATPFRFLPDAAKQPEAHVFHRLLTGDVPSVIQKSQQRDQDGRMFKYAGVGGIDQPRIVEVGMEATFRDRLDQSLGVRRLVEEIVGNDVREVQILDRQLAPVVTRRVDAAGIATDVPLALQQADAELVRDSMTSGRRRHSRRRSGVAASGARQLVCSDQAGRRLVGAEAGLCGEAVGGGDLQRGEGGVGGHLPSQASLARSPRDTELATRVSRVLRNVFSTALRNLN